MSRRPYIEAIEPRLLYSADLAAAVGGQSLQPLRTFEQGRLDTLELQAAAQQATPRVEIALVDRSVPDAAQLIADLRAQQQAGRRIEIVTLWAQEDGIARLTELLRGRQDVGAVHVLGHGADGVVQLGGVRLDAATLLARAGEVATWGAALADDADVLLYGCDVAASEKGRQLIADLAALTGADVAASDDATGAAALGGNWTLEARTGAVEAALAPSEQARQAWSGLLQEFVVTRFDDTTEEGSLRWAINQAAKLGGDHVIRLAAGTYQISLKDKGSPNDGDFDITGAGRLQIVGAGAALTRIEITDQAASRIFAVGAGAGLELSGVMLLGDGSSADADTGGVIQLATGAALTLTDSVIEGGKAGLGGAISVEAGASATLQRVEIRKATAGGASPTKQGLGGAIYNAGSLTLTDSTLAGNQATGDGGALYQAAEGGTLELRNVTLSGNQAVDGRGGGLYSESDLSLVNVTLAANQAGAAGASGAAVYVDSGRTLEARNTLFANNTVADGSDRPLGGGTLVSLGNNLYTSDSKPAGAAGSDIVTPDAKIGALEASVTLTRTHKLLPGSPAIDAGSTDASVPSTDQRGAPRYGSSPDIGAYELSYGPRIVTNELAIPEGGRAKPTLEISDPNDAPANVTLTVSGLVAGAVEVRGAPATTFTLQDVLDQVVEFVHDGSETPAAYTLTATDPGGASTSSSAFVTFTRVNDAPVLTGAAALASIVEDVASGSNAGTRVSDLIPTAAQATDVDSTSLGIAVTAADVARGSWEYSLNGTTWLALGIPSNSAARLLPGDARVRFVPQANLSGTATLTFRAWDRSTGVDAGVADTAHWGGTSAFSAATASASVTVVAVNDAPSGAHVTRTTLEDTDYTLKGVDFGFTDSADAPAANALSGVRIATLPALGNLLLSGVPVVAGQVVSATDIDQNRLIYRPATHGNGTNYASFGFQVVDDGGTASGGVNQDPSAKTFTFNVTGVSDAPDGVDSVITLLEDSGTRAIKASDFGFTDSLDSPSDTFVGVVISNGTGGGTLLYRGAPCASGQFVSAAELAGDRLQFVLPANANGANYASFQFAVVDSGSIADGGSTQDLTPATMRIDVTAVSDAPSGATITKTLPEDASYALSTADFGFSDTNDTPSNALSGVRISTLPSKGSLWREVNGVWGTLTTAGQVVSAADIAAGRLVYFPVSNESGTSPYASFTFQVIDGGGTANGGIDTDPTPRSFGFNVSAVNDAPVLSGSANLAAIDEDNQSSSGTAVSALVVGGRITDVDASALQGIAVVAADSANGTWQYRTGPFGWTNFPATSASTALLLTTGATIRFQPNPDWSGTASLTFRAWDRTSGTEGTTADVTANGGTTAFSTATATASITVNNINEAPILTSAAPVAMPAIVANDTANAGATVASLIAGRTSDADPSPAPHGIAVVAADNSKGYWQWSPDGTSWTAFGHPNVTGARLLPETYRVRFVPGVNYTGTANPGLTFHVWDRTSGTDGGTADLTTRGGSTAFSTDSSTVIQQVTGAASP
jgi:hypothetical protein